jgi:two-component system sensor histidine kinase UhpB
MAMAAEGDAKDETGDVEAILERVRELGDENRRILADLTAGERRYRRLARAVWRIEEEERRRLARELHDGVGQKLTALKNQLQGLHRRLEPDAAAGDELAAAADLAAETLDDTRELSRLLRPPVLDDLGLIPALRWLARTLESPPTLVVGVEGGLDERPPRNVETVLFRIAQEALTNVVRHAAATRATISVRQDGGWLEIEVRDDGRGFDVAAGLDAGEEGAGTGLGGMRDRLELFGGHLRLRSTRPGGTIVHGRMPRVEVER